MGTLGRNDSGRTATMWGIPAALAVLARFVGSVREVTEVGTRRTERALHVCLGGERGRRYAVRDRTFRCGGVAASPGLGTVAALLAQLRQEHPVLLRKVRVRIRAQRE